MNEIVVARMVWTGMRSSDGRYESPIPDIVLDPNSKSHSKTTDTLSYNIEVLNTDLEIKVPISYQEASENLDHPSFKLTLLDDNGRVLKEAIQEYKPDQVGDHFLHFDTMDSTLSITIPLNEFTSGVPNTLNLKLEAELEQWEWVDRKFKGATLETMSETKYITVTVTADDVETVRVNATFPTTVDWKSFYHIQMQVENLDTESITYTVSLTEKNEQGDVRIVPLDRDSYPEIAGGGFTLASGYKQSLLSESIQYAWGWWYHLHPFVFATPNHPNAPQGNIEGLTYEKEFEYTILFTLDTIGGTLIGKHYTPLIGKTKIKVSDEKEEAGDEAYAQYINASALFVLMTIAALAGSILAAFFALAFAIKAAEAYNLAIIAMACPVDFDHHFKEAVSPDQIESNFKELDFIPEEMKPFTDSFDSFLIHQQIHEVSSARYLSAISRNDRASSGKQKIQAERAIKHMRDALIEMRSSLREFKRYEKKIITKEDPTQIFNRLLEEGIDQKTREEMKKRPGVSENVLEYIESQLKSCDIEDITIQLSSVMEDAIKTMEDINHRSLLKMKRIERIQQLNKEDRLLEILDEGMISPGEYYTQRKKKEKATNYLLAELEEIESKDRQALFDERIRTTSDLSNRCSNEREIGRLARRTGISKAKLLHWVNLSDLMQITGIGERDARLLLTLGIRNRAALRKVKPAALSKKAEGMKNLKKAEKKRLTAKRLSSWLKSVHEQSTR